MSTSPQIKKYLLKVCKTTDVAEKISMIRIGEGDTSSPVEIRLKWNMNCSTISKCLFSTVSILAVLALLAYCIFVLVTSNVSRPCVVKHTGQDGSTTFGPRNHFHWCGIEHQVRKSRREVIVESSADGQIVEISTLTDGKVTATLDKDQKLTIMVMEASLAVYFYITQDVRLTVTHRDLLTAIGGQLGKMREFYLGNCTQEYGTYFCKKTNECNRVSNFQAMFEGQSTEMTCYLPSPDKYSLTRKTSFVSMFNEIDFFYTQEVVAVERATFIMGGPEYSAPDSFRVSDVIIECDEHYDWPIDAIHILFGAEKNLEITCSSDDRK